MRCKINSSLYFYYKLLLSILHFFIILELKVNTVLQKCERKVEQTFEANWEPPKTEIKSISLQEFYRENVMYRFEMHSNISIVALNYRCREVVRTGQ